MIGNQVALVTSRCFNNCVRSKTKRLGFDGYCKLLDYLRDGKTTEQVAQRFDIRRDIAKKLLRMFRQVRLIHRRDWYRPAPHSRLFETWFLGGDGDVPPPDRRDLPIACAPRVLEIAKAIHALEQGVTLIELADGIDRSPDTARYIVDMLREVGLVKLRYRTVPVGAPQRVFTYTTDATVRDGHRKANSKARKQAQNLRWKKEFRHRHRVRNEQLFILRALAGKAPPRHKTHATDKAQEHASC